MNFFHIDDVAFEKKEDQKFIAYLCRDIRKMNYVEHILAHLVSVKNNVKYQLSTFLAVCEIKD